MLVSKVRPAAFGVGDNAVVSYESGHIVAYMMPNLAANAALVSHRCDGAAEPELIAIDHDNVLVVCDELQATASGEIVGSTTAWFVASLTSGGVTASGRYSYRMGVTAPTRTVVKSGGSWMVNFGDALAPITGLTGQLSPPPSSLRMPAGWWATVASTSESIVDAIVGGMECSAEADICNSETFGLFRIGPSGSTKLAMLRVSPVQVFALKDGGALVVDADGLVRYSKDGQKQDTLMKTALPSAAVSENGGVGYRDGDKIAWRGP
ncbi:MAG: hypothetical protein ACHREM_02700 [Polyangiales bacterium]